MGIPARGSAHPSRFSNIKNPVSSRKFSTGLKSIPVTNNLYRGNWKSKTDSMLQGPSPNVASHPEAPRFQQRGAGSRVEPRTGSANSLFPNILPATLGKSIFCPYLRMPETRNHLKTEILDITYEKNFDLDIPARERSLTPYRHPPRLRV